MKTMWRVRCTSFLVAAALCLLASPSPIQAQDELAWQPNVPVNDDTGGNNQWYPSIAASKGPNGGSYAAWTVGNFVYVDYRPKGGAWGNEVVVNDTAIGGSRPGIAADAAGNGYVIWAGTGGIYSTVLPPGGGWDPNTLVRTKINDIDSDALPYADIAVDSSGNVHAVWYDRRQGSRNLFSDFRTAGGEWETDTPVNDVWGSVASAGSQRPSMTTDSSGNVYAVWVDGRNGSPEIFLAIRNQGNPWSASEKVEGPSGGDPDIAVDGNGNVYVVWSASAAGGDIYFNYRPAGESFAIGTVEKINDDTNLALQGAPAIGVDNVGNAYAVWSDRRNGFSDLFDDIYSAYRPASENWKVYPNVLVNDDDEDGGYPAQTYPDLAIDSDGYAQAVWMDKRNTNWDIYFSTTATAPAGREPVIFLPGILGSEFVVTNDFSLSVDDGHGGTFERDYKEGDIVWFNCIEMVNGIQDDYFDVLKMQSDGRTPIAPNLEVGDIVNQVNCFDVYEKEIYSDWIPFFQNLNVGYMPGINLFEFPYDWRADIATTVHQLDAKIQDYLVAANGGETDESLWAVTKVNLISHSMGGSVVRAYINDPVRSAKVHRAIALSPAYLGAPKFLKALLFGDDVDACIKDKEENKIICFLNNQETKDLVQNMPGAFQVGPSKMYWDFYDGSTNELLVPFREDRDFDGDGQVLGDLDFDQTKDLLNNIDVNMQVFDIAESFHNTIDNSWDDGTPIPVHIITGSGVCTPGQLIAKYKINFDILGKQIQLLPEVDMYHVNGDGTVPQFSSTLSDTSRSIDHSGGAQIYYDPDLEHGDIVKPDESNAMQLVANILNDNPGIPEGLTQNPQEVDCSGEMISAESPVELHITDIEGRHTGLTTVEEAEEAVIEESIPGSSYDQILDSKFIYLPDEGVYKIGVKATDEGEFTLRLRTYGNNKIERTVIYAHAPLSLNTTGELLYDTEVSEIPVLRLDHNSDGEADEEVSPTSVLGLDESVDSEAPIITINSLIEGGEVLEETMISWSVEDAGSGILNEMAVIDEDTPEAQVIENNTVKELPVGEHTLTVGAEDRAGNASFEEIHFQVIPLSLGIDIWPGLKTNPIVFSRRLNHPIGIIPIAILSTTEFNAPENVNKTSLTFGKTGDEQNPYYCLSKNKDLNRDGLKDLLCFFTVNNTGFKPGDTEGVLKGITNNGSSFEGNDSVYVLSIR